jgi:glycosyltransferase involved in cell wall biosynthesis
MDNKKPICVSVIVPCYNDGIYLKECLDSVLNQTFSDWECIVIDNGSTDNTKEIASYFVQKDKRFIYQYQSNKGVSSARNNGIKNSRGKYIFPLDADDKIVETYLQKAVMVLDENTQIKIVYCDAELFGNSSGKWKLPEFSVKQMLTENIIFCSALYRRSDYDKTSGYNESMETGFEDWDFWLSLLNKDSDVFKIPEILFSYRIKTHSRNSSLDEAKQKSLRMIIFENHKELYASNLNTSDLIFEYYLLKNKSEMIFRSYDYALGKALLAPCRFVRKLLRK